MRKFLKDSGWFITPTLFAFISLCGLVKQFWWFKMDRQFGDLIGVTAAVQCVSDNPSWTLADSTCDPFGRPFNNSTILIKLLSTLGVRFAHTNSIGYGFTFGLISICIFLTYKIRNTLLANHILHFVWIILWNSPSMFLLSERGNIDSFVALLVILFIVQSRPSLYSLILVLFASLVKFYPLILGFAIIISRTITLFRKIVVAFAFCVFSLMVYKELGLVYRHTVQVGDFSFGVRQPFLFFQDLLNSDWLPPKIQYSAPIMFLGFTISICWILQNTKKGKLLLKESLPLDVDSASFRAGLLFLGIFIVGNSYDYRLIFFVIFIGALIHDGQVTKRDVSMYFALGISNLLGFLNFPVNFLFDFFLYSYLAFWLAKIVLLNKYFRNVK
jgi:hypothetical protein